MRQSAFPPYLPAIQAPLAAHRNTVTRARARSGSMAQAASRIRSSPEGGRAPEYSRLNLVEHAVRTSMAMLGDHDTAAIISFSDKAGIDTPSPPRSLLARATHSSSTVMRLPLTRMNSEGKAAADKALTQIDPGTSRGSPHTTHPRSASAAPLTRRRRHHQHLGRSESSVGHVTRQLAVTLRQRQHPSAH